MVKKKSILKSIITYLMVIVVFAEVVCNPLQVSAAAKKGSGNDYKAGDNIAFGTIDGRIVNWTVLAFDAESREAFVVTTVPVTSKTFNECKTEISKYNMGKNVGYVPWGQNIWRAWLNGPFYRDCFNDAERAMIQPTTFSKDSEQNSIMNFYHDTTLDQYYLDHDKEKNSLNIAIYNSQYATTNYVFFLSSDEYTAYRDLITSTNAGALWPLRTNAYDDPVKSLYVNDKTKTIERRFHYDSGCSGIRPAMVIKVKDAAENDPITGNTKDKSKGNKTGDSKTTDQTKAASSGTNQNSTNKTVSKQETPKKTTSKKSYANNATDVGAVSGGTINLPDAAQYSMKKNGTANVTIDLDYLNSSSKQYTVTYKSSDASIFTVDSNGLVTASGVAGSATLTVKMKKSNGKTYSMTCRIDVA